MIPSHWERDEGGAFEIVRPGHRVYYKEDPHPAPPPLIFLLTDSSIINTRFHHGTVSGNWFVKSIIGVLGWVGVNPRIGHGTINPCDMKISHIYSIWISAPYYFVYVKRGEGTRGG